MIRVVVAAGAAAATITATSAGRADPATERCTRAGSHGGTSYLLCVNFGTGDHGSFFALHNGRRRQLAIASPGSTPTARDAGRVGHWEWAALSPDGRVFLTQWSADCETPIAFFVRSGRRPRPVTGERDWAHSPESAAFGWTTDGRAIVKLPRGACGAGAARPGLYLIGRDGRRTYLRGSGPDPVRSLRPRALGDVR